MRLNLESNKGISKIKGAIIIEGHVQGLSNVRSLGELGIPVFVIDKTNCIARYSKYCKKFFYCPDFNDDSFTDLLIKIALEENIEGWAILPSNDHAVLNISKHKQKLEPYYKFLIPDLHKLMDIYDKSRLLKLAKEIGVPIPKTYYPHNIIDTPPNNLSFPAITKGRFGLSFYQKFGKKAYFSYDARMLKKHLHEISKKYNLKDTFTQELIPFDKQHKTVSFTAFTVEGSIMTYWMGVKLREHPLRFGTATMAESVFIKDCLVQSQSLLYALEYTGVCEIEYLFDPIEKVYKLIEINPRTWLWVGLAKACGVDYAKIIYRYLNCDEIDFPSNYTIGIRWKNLFTNTAMYLAERINKDKNSSLSIKKRKKYKTIPAIFSSQDPLPSIIFILMIPILFFKRT